MNDFTVGVDLGGTSIRIGVMPVGGELIEKTSFPTRVAAGPDCVISDMVTGINQLIDTLPARSNVRGIGIGSPGPINLRDGVLGLLPNFPGWDGFPLREKLRSATGLPVILESDANAAALAEWKMGSHSGANAQNRRLIRSMCMITLGTGVGSGLILNGSIWHGILGMGGEVGHCSIDPMGEECSCGNRGCLELYASATGLLRSARKAMIPDAISSHFSTQGLSALAKAGDRDAMAIFSRMGEALGLALTSLINTLDLELYVLGGGVAQSWDLFAPAMFEVLESRSFVYKLSKPTQREFREDDKPFVTCASLGTDSGVIGAALLPTLHPMSTPSLDIVERPYREINANPN